KEIQRRSAQHDDRERKREEAARRQERYKLLKPLKNRIDRVEKEIASLEEQKAEIENNLADEATYRDEEKAKTLTQQYREVSDKLGSVYADWESVQEEIEKIETEFEG
ncbi:MAG: hypothetical protein C0600_05815, partial [Ignavibacteria bacterium]